MSLSTKPNRHRPRKVSATWSLALLLAVGSLVGPAGTAVGQETGGSSASEEKPTLQADLFFGNWLGLVNQSNMEKDYEVVVEVSSLNDIELRYPDIPCRGVLSQTKLEGDTITGVVSLTSGKNLCLDGGAVSLKLVIDKDVLIYQWTSAQDPGITAYANCQTGLPIPYP